MKARRFLTMVLALLLAGTGAAWAHGVRGHVGIQFGPVWGAPGWWYPPPYYYPPQVIVVPSSPPPVYIEQQEAPAAEDQAYWYFCKSAKAYYPYIKECPEGWQKVLPQPEK